VEPSDPQADPRPKAGTDDVTLTRKVESVVSRMDGYDKAKIDLNTVDGVVYVRGEAKRPDSVEAIEAAVRGIPEVRDVANLLHLPKSPARTRADAPGKASMRKTAADAPTKATGRFERDVAGAEPTAKDLAPGRTGRQPAPLGSDDEGDGRD
jgi:hypothetical protein